jgi:hypothetical protein
VQQFQPVARRRAQVSQIDGVFQIEQLVFDKLIQGHPAGF